MLKQLNILIESCSIIFVLFLDISSPFCFFFHLSMLMFVLLLLILLFSDSFYPCGSLLFYVLYNIVPFSRRHFHCRFLFVFLLLLTILLFIICWVKTSKRVKGLTPPSRVVLGQVFSPAIKLEYLNYPWSPPPPPCILHLFPWFCLIYINMFSLF